MGGKNKYINVFGSFTFPSIDISYIKSCYWDLNTQGPRSLTCIQTLTLHVQLLLLLIKNANLLLC